MKKIILSVTGTLLITAVLSLMFVSCNKDNIENTNPNQETLTPTASDVNFTPYYQEAESLSLQFWSACDAAYHKYPDAFLKACQDNDLATFQRLTNLNQEYFDHFKAVLLQAKADIESDHPGLCRQYDESPCSECTDLALPRIGQVVDSLQGNSAVCMEKLNNSDCWFVCSLSCMATMELYVPCVLACVKICRKYMQNW